MGQHSETPTQGSAPVCLRPPERYNTVPSSNAATFADLGVPSDLVAVLTAGEITVPTPIQAATLPDWLAAGTHHGVVILGGKMTTGAAKHR